MFSLIRKWPQLRSTVTAIGCANNYSNCSSRSQSSQINANSHGSQNAERADELERRQQFGRAVRTLTTLRNPPVRSAARAKVLGEESRTFMAVFPDIVRELSEAVKSHNCTEAAQWFAKALEYNVPLGKRNRGLLTVLTYKNLVKSDQLTAENLRLAYLLGWCVEMLQCYFIVSDDIMDNSTTRRGQLCWHKLEEVGIIAINDVLMIENGIFELLRTHFRHLDCYIDLVDLFHQISFITTCGQSLDLLNANKNVNAFTMQNYDTIVASKTSNYTFYLPFALALHLAGIKDPEAFRQSKIILLEMGNFYQVQDDFLDCFGDPEVTGKIGTDIQDNKCSWLAVTCMQLANPQQKAIMEQCYGQNDSEKIARVKQLYEELEIPRIYAIYENETYNRIKARIEKTSFGIPHEIFLQILNKVYRRDC